MSSFGRINGSLASFTNENTAALVNINFDLTLLRCEPMAEFHPVGSALTTRRREEAESGQAHKTACKLGCLLQDLIPNVPELRKAYGKRVSQILAKPNANPQGTDSDGPFRSFIGADCTSIWAAATSGNPAICVLLLTCMLANAFDAKTAVSIWSELIDQRKQNIQQESNEMANPFTRLAAELDFTRSELSTWDASARSWLRVADSAMGLQKTQFTLIAENVAIPYPGGVSVFERVTTAWIRAMEVFEKLLNNNPQQACDRSIISGISAWHLYPDLLVFQTEAKKVPFNDELLPNSGVLTLGLEYKGKPSDNFIRWSLALSHLRYYGDPVPVRSNEALPRVTMSDTWLVALGSLIRYWGIPYNSAKTVLAWFEQLGKRIYQSFGRDRPEISWLLRLCDAATDIPVERRQIAERLVKLGCRLGRCFLGDPNTVGSQTPFFGLCNPGCFDAMSQENDVDAGVEWLRHMSWQVGLDADQAVVEYKGRVGDRSYTEWATIRPTEAHRAGCSAGNASTSGSEMRYVRWIYCPLEGDSTPIAAILEARAQRIRQQGELCQIITHDRGFLNSPPDLASREVPWHNPPPMLQTQPPLYFLNRLGGKSLGFGDFDLWIKTTKQENSRWDRKIQDAIGQNSDLDRGLAWISNTRHAAKITKYLLTYLCEVRSGVIAQASVRKRRASFSSSELLSGGVFRGDVGCFNVMTNLVPRSPELIIALRALEVASGLYKRLPGATISLDVSKQDLTKACWLPSPLKSALEKATTGARGDSFNDTVSTPIDDQIKAMTRQDSFACVAMFESGRFNIDPGRLTEVIALCCENSIFVTEILLFDPSVDSSKLGLRHMVGNVGHAGMVLMISPIEPRIRPARHDLVLVDHNQYDNKVVDKLQGTSLHLSFTTWKMPLDWENTGEIDQEVFLLESVVSVQDNGTWVADIDVLERERDGLDVITFPCDCPDRRCPPSLDAVSMDTWEEFLDPPPCMGVFRAKGNWAARLAAASILIQQGRGNAAVIIDGDKVCWRCMNGLYSEPEPHFPQVVIY